MIIFALTLAGGGVLKIYYPWVLILSINQNPDVEHMIV